MKTFNPERINPGRLGHLVHEATHLAHIVSAAVRAAIVRRGQHRRLHRQARLLSELDTRTLKDIGLHHSEIGSIMAELVERAETSRRRVHRDKVDSVSPLY